MAPPRPCPTGSRALEAPVDANLRVIEAHRALGFGRVVIGALVDDLGIRLPRDETVQEAFGDQQLFAVLETQLDPDPAAEGRAALADIDGHVEQPPAPAAHQLGLPVRGRLEMQAAHRGRLARQGMIVLHEIVVEAVVRHHPPVPAFAEKAARVTEAARDKHHQPINSRLFDTHDFPLSVRRRLARGLSAKVQYSATIPHGARDVSVCFNTVGLMGSAIEMQACVRDRR